MRSAIASDIRLHLWLAKLLLNCLQQVTVGLTPLCAMWRKLQAPLLLQALVSRQASAATLPYIQIPQILLLVLAIVGSCQSLLPGLHRFVRMRASPELGYLTARRSNCALGSAVQRSPELGYLTARRSNCALGSAVQRSSYGAKGRPSHPRLKEPHRRSARSTNCAPAAPFV